MAAAHALIRVEQLAITWLCGAIITVQEAAVARLSAWQKVWFATEAIRSATKSGGATWLPRFLVLLMHLQHGNHQTE